MISFDKNIINMPVYGPREVLESSIMTSVAINCYHSCGNFSSASVSGQLKFIEISDLISLIIKEFGLKEYSRAVSNPIFSDAKLKKVYLANDNCFVNIGGRKSTMGNEIEHEDDDNDESKTMSDNNWEIFFGGAKDTCDRLTNVFRKYIVKNNEQSLGIYCVMETRYGLNLHHIGYPARKIIPTNYSEKVMSEFDRIVEDINSSSPSGCLSIISGPAGTGKTYMARGIIEATEKDALFIMIPPSILANISGPHMIPLLVDIKSDYLQHKNCVVFVVEDADSILVPRGADNMSAISTLLNVTDGILGSLFQMRVIATTNANSLDFDPALTRPGRLSCRVDIGPLGVDEAIRAYNAISKTEDGDRLITKDTTLAEVYALASGNNYVFEEDDKGRLGF